LLQGDAEDDEGQRHQYAQQCNTSQAEIHGDASITPASMVSECMVPDLVVLLHPTDAVIPNDQWSDHDDDVKYVEVHGVLLLREVVKDDEDIEDYFVEFPCHPPGDGNSTQ
jgi:hypothetical protein